MYYNVSIHFLLWIYYEQFLTMKTSKFMVVHIHFVLIHKCYHVLLFLPRGKGGLDEQVVSMITT